MAAADEYWNLGAENTQWYTAPHQRTGHSSNTGGGGGASTGGWGGNGGALPNWYGSGSNYTPFSGSTGGDPFEAMNTLLESSTYGGYWSQSTGTISYSNDDEAFLAGCLTNEIYNYWGSTAGGSLNSVVFSYRLIKQQQYATLTAGPGGVVDGIQTGLDVAGIADPTGVVDLVNALIYAGRGQWGNAGISALAIIPYIGDVGKAGRLGAKTLNIIPFDGFKHAKQFGYPHGQKVFEYNGKFFSKDIDSHNGGVWKVFEEVNGKLKRIGTADESLKIFKY